MSALAYTQSLSVPGYGGAGSGECCLQVSADGLSARGLKGGCRAEIEVAGKLSVCLAMPVTPGMSHVIYLRSSSGEVLGHFRSGRQATNYRVEVDPGSGNLVICIPDQGEPLYSATLKQHAASMQLDLTRSMQLYLGVYMNGKGHEVRIVQ